jgi:hypothetical protein
MAEAREPWMLAARLFEIGVGVYGEIGVFDGQFEQLKLCCGHGGHDNGLASVDG